MSAKLTEKVVKKLAAAPGEYLETWDSSWRIPGSSFGVRVSGVTGSKSWVLLYRKDGRGRRQTLGTSATMTLAEARSAASDIAAGVVRGEDPVEERKAAKGAQTFREMAERWLEDWPSVTPRGRRPRPRTMAGYARTVDELVERWGDLKATEVTRAHVVELLDEIRKRGAQVYANRVRTQLGTMFTWAVSRSLVTTSPVVLIPLVKEESRKRVLTADEIRALWAATDKEAEPIRSLFRFLLVCGQRSGETRLARWKLVKGGVWEIPAADTKADRAQRVPLSSLALAILEDLRAVTGNSVYVFETPSDRSSGPIKWVHRATERLRERVAPPCPKCKKHGYYVRVEEEDGSKWYCVCRSCADTKWPVKKPWTVHDLRRTMGSGLRDLRVAPDVIGKLLNHADSLATKGSTPIYMQTDRWPEQVEGMDLWGAHLEHLLGAGQSQVVVSIGGAA